MKIKDIVNPLYHSLIEDKGMYYSILAPDFKIPLLNFLTQWEKIRRIENTLIIPFEEYHLLPFSKVVAQDFEWKWRKRSLSVVEELLPHLKSKTILEIGGWNCWLTNKLVEKNCEVVSIDFFSDEIDGLSSKKYYKNKWISIQCNCEQPGFLNPIFDTIIVNHCLQFTTDPIKFCDSLKNLLVPGGKIILIGLNVYKNPSKKILAIEKFKEHFLKTYNFNVFMQANKAYLDAKDREELSKLGFKIVPQQKLFLRNIYSWLRPTKPTYCFGVFSK